MWAAHGGHTEIVKLLLGFSGVELNSQNNVRFSLLCSLLNVTLFFISSE